MSGPIARDVIRAELLQRCAEADGDFCPDNRPIDFPSRWCLYAHLHLASFEVALRHEAATRRDHAVRAAVRQAVPA